MPISFLERSLAKKPLRSQREACAFAARLSIAGLGPADDIISACSALCIGLFGEHWDQADWKERLRLLALMEEEYRKALGH